MSKESSRKRKAAREPENFVGASYLCCSGPRKGQAITVVESMPGEERYRLEDEKGGRWTIAAEKLRRIFGPAPERACQCSPLARVKEKSSETVGSSTSEAEETPADVAASEAPKRQEREPENSPAEVVKSNEPPLRDETILQPTLF